MGKVGNLHVRPKVGVGLDGRTAVDQEKFDALVQKLTADASRRGVVRGALTGAVASALGAVGIQAADAKKKKGDGGDGPNDERCVPNGRKCGKCGKKKNGKPKCKPCTKCCSRNSEENDRGVTRCQCKPSGSQCGNGAQCCSGDCRGGFCVEYGYGADASGRNKKARGGKRNR